MKLRHWMGRALAASLPLGAVVVEAQSVNHGPVSRSALIERGDEALHLTGDWGGWRNWLVDHGIHFQAGYVGEAFGNVTGGLRTGAIYEGIMEAALGIDLEQITDGAWRGAQIHVCGLWTFGASPSAKLAGDIMTLSNIDAYDGVRLYEWWLEQNFFADELSFRAGSLLADSEFSGMRYEGVFINSAPGWPNFIALNTFNNGPGFPTPSLGLRVRWAPVSNWFIQAGVYDGDNFDSPTGDPRVNNRGLRYELNREQGAFSIYETGFSWNSSDDSPGLPGDVRVGGWQHTHVFDDNYRDANGDSYIVTGLPPLQHKGIWGVYLGVDQMLWREGDEPGQREQGLGMFARGGYTPRNRSFVEFVFDAGFDYVGLLPGRDEDEFGVLFVYAPVSRDIARRERDDAAFNGTSYAAFASYEFVFEVTYRCVVTPWCIVQPDLQWIHNPSGSSALEDALLFGLRSTLTF